MRRLAVISGGGTGIGYAVAEALVQDCDVVLLGRRRAVLDAAAGALRESGIGRVDAYPGDLSVPEQVQRVAAQVLEGRRRVDILVNNAGGNVAPTPAADVGGVREQYLANFSANVLPVVLLTQALLPALTRPGGRIVTVSSIAAFRGNASYGAAKAGLHPWSAELATRLASDGVTVNVVAPGYIADTEFYGCRMTAQFHEGRSAQVPLGRGGSPAEVAAMVRYLASAEAGFVTGQILQINGGASPGRG